MINDKLIINKKEFNSRLLIGTGKFGSNKDLENALKQSCSEIVTVALKRYNPNDKENNYINILNNKKITFLPNTSGARNAEEAIKIAKIARQAKGWNWIKLEIHPEKKHLLPDPIETLLAAETLVKEGFTVLPYINADPVLAKKLEEVGCHAVMPLGSPIGSFNGIQTIEMIKIIIENSKVPVIVDAGIGKPSHSSLAMEIGADAVLVNSAIAINQNPELIAKAFKMSVEAGRLSYLYGKNQNTIDSISCPSSPLDNDIEFDKIIGI